MVVSGAAEKIRRTTSDERLVKPLEMIATAVKRGATLTGHLLREMSPRSERRSNSRTRQLSVRSHDLGFKASAGVQTTNK